MPQKEGVRCCDAPVQAVLPKSGWILYAFFKVHRHFGVYLCIPTSICQCHCPRQDVAWTVWPMNGIPWRAAASRSCPDGTVTQNAKPVRVRQITTRLLPRKQGDVAAPFREWKRREERRLVTRHCNSSEPQDGNMSGLQRNFYKITQMQSTETLMNKNDVFKM